MRIPGASQHPTRIVPMGFLAAIAVGTVLLMLPVSSAHGGSTGLTDAAFTAISATCITGLTVVDTATYWSPFGLVMILLMIQLGGLGIMTAATLLILLVSGSPRRSASATSGRSSSGSPFSSSRSRRSSLPCSRRGS